MPDAVYTADRQIWRDGHLGEGTRLIPEETAIALTYNGGTYAVMMGTPQNLQDFAVGFSLSEGIVRSPDEIVSLDIVELDDGTKWRVFPGDLDVTLNWQPDADLKVVRIDDDVSSHALISASDNSRVRVIPASENWPVSDVRIILKDG